MFNIPLIHLACIFVIASRR